MSSETHNLKRLGARLRERRLAAGLSQSGAARAAGVGRSTLIHFEHGRKDIRLSNLLSIADAVGASLGLEAGVSPNDERIRLRAEQARLLAHRRERHLALAVDLALGRPGAVKALGEARTMVALWRRERTCSDYYIEEWARILSGKPAQVAARIRAIDEPWREAAGRSRNPDAESRRRVRVLATIPAPST